MTVTREFFVLFCATIITFALRCAAAHQLPEPVNLSYKWIDPFQVNVTWEWKKPHHLPKNCSTIFVVSLQTKDEPQNTLTTNKFYTQEFYTEEFGSGQWNFTIKKQACDGWTESKSTPITIKTRKPHAKVVEDFKCYIEPNKLNCSWTPVDPSVALNVSYRYCGHDKMKQCSTSDRGMRSCHLDYDFLKVIAVCAETDAGLTTFKPRLVIPVPPLSIKVEEDLLLQFDFPQVGSGCIWNYDVNYTECGERRPSRIFKLEKNETTPKTIPYKESCRYEFNYTVKSVSYCPDIFADGSKTVHYGTNIPPDETLTVVAIILPIILCACVILSCYCVRRHSAIFCPVIPDPSTIFKEMMNGNRDLKPPGNLYLPVPEPIEKCSVALVSEGANGQKNS